MDHYNKLPFRQLQKEAKELGIHPVAGKGINRLMLLSQVEEYLNNKEKEKEEHEIEEKEKREREKQIAHLIEEPTHTVPLSKAEEMLQENNKELYRFLLPVIDKVPSLRQTKFVEFEENPWDLILDELNAMNELDYDILNILINENEKTVSYLIAMEKENLFLFFERYPILSYAIILRRRPEESWIINAVVISEAYRIYPSSELIKPPYYKKEELHPFSRFFLAENTEEAYNLMYPCREYIRIHSGDIFDADLYLLLLKVLEYIIVNAQETGSALLNPFFFDTYGKLPLTKDILLVYFSIYKSLKKEDLSLFTYHVTLRIFLPTIPLNLFKEYVMSSLFFDHMVFITDSHIRERKTSFGSIENHMAIIIHNILCRDDEATAVLIKGLRKHKHNIYASILSSLPIYAKDAIMLDHEIPEDAYAQNFLLLIKDLFFLTWETRIEEFLRQLFAILSNDKIRSKLSKRKLFNFLSVIVKGTKKNDNMDKLIRRSGLSDRDKNRLLKLQSY